MAELIHSDTFLVEKQRQEMRKGCDLPCSNLFILSLNLIGIAQLVPYIEPKIVSNNNRDFP